MRRAYTFLPYDVLHEERQSTANAIVIVTYVDLVVRLAPCRFRYCEPSAE